MDGDKVLRGSREICAFVGVNWKEMSVFVKNEGLPAFRIREKGNYIALQSDLILWVKKQRDAYMK